MEYSIEISQETKNWTTIWSTYLTAEDNPKGNKSMKENSTVMFTVALFIISKLSNIFMNERRKKEIIILLCLKQNVQCVLLLNSDLGWKQYLKWTSAHSVGQTELL